MRLLQKMEKGKSENKNNSKIVAKNSPLKGLTKSVRACVRACGTNAVLTGIGSVPKGMLLPLVVCVAIAQDQHTKWAQQQQHMHNNFNSSIMDGIKVACCLSIFFLFLYQSHFIFLLLFGIW